MSHMWVVLTEHLFNFFVRWYFLSREGGGFLPYCSKGGSVVPTQISLRSPTQRCFLQKGGKGRVLRNQLEISSLSDPHGSFLLSANNGGLTKHVRNTPGWKQDRLAESAPTSFGETKNQQWVRIHCLSVKPSFYGVCVFTFVVVLQLLASGVSLHFVVLLPFVEETSPPPGVFDSSPPPVAVNNSKITN